jgi:hypothetical protein
MREKVARGTVRPRTSGIPTASQIKRRTLLVVLLVDRNGTCWEGNGDVAHARLTARLTHGQGQFSRRIRMAEVAKAQDVDLRRA